MIRASYRNGIEFIALNDEAMDQDAESIAGYTTVVLLSELFGVDREKIAKDILRIRKRETKLGTITKEHNYE